MTAKPLVQAWELTLDGHSHRVEVRGSISRHVQWWRDGELVAEKKSADDKFEVKPTERPELGLVALRFSGLGKPRRATLHLPSSGSADLSVQALTGLGGIDLDPEPGSPAATYENKVRAHPRRYALIQTSGGLAAVIVPILVTLLLARLAFSINWPDWNLPSIPLPNLPNLPNLPSIPFPDLPKIPFPDISLPGWVEAILDKAKYVWPIVFAYVLARGEIRRRTKQDELKAHLTGAQKEQAKDQHNPG